MPHHKPLLHAIVIYMYVDYLISVIFDSTAA